MSHTYPKFVMAGEKLMEDSSGNTRTPKPEAAPMQNVSKKSLPNHTSKSALLLEFDRANGIIPINAIKIRHFLSFCCGKCYTVYNIR